MTNLEKITKHVRGPIDAFSREVLALRPRRADRLADRHLPPGQLADA